MIFKHKIFKKILCFMLALAVVCPILTMSGCMAENFSVYFGITEMPYNIDPQKAQSQAELLAVRNCFRGLYKQDKDGNAVPDLAKTTEKSADGLTYTFTLHAAEWKNGSPVISDDFLFALQRASDPVTKSAFAHLLINIRGVEKRLSGEGDGSIGVAAPNDNTLVITLSKPDKNFTTKLTQAVFMPCNREFFEATGGKYGLDRKNILTNGAYYPSQWVEDKHLKLTMVNEPDSRYLVAENVYLSVSTTGKSNLQRIKAKEIGVAVDSSVDLSGINTEVYKVESLYLKNYALVFNKTSAVGESNMMTDAFARAIHREKFKVNMNERFIAAESVLPEDSTLFSSAVGGFESIKYGYELDSEAARAEFLQALKEMKNGKLPEIKVLCIDTPEIRAVLNEIVSQWQSVLGAYVNVSLYRSEESLLEDAKSGSFTAALVPLSGTAPEILSLFAEGDSGLYIDNEEYDALVKKLNDTDDSTSAKQYIEDCLTILSTESSVIPVISVPTSYIYNSGYYDLYFSRLDGTVDFSIIYKKQ